MQYGVRQAAAIQLKNICRDCWIQRVSFIGGVVGDGNDQNILSEDDKNFIKIHLIRSMLLEPDKSLTGLMAETLHSIAIHDFPDKWPTLLDTLLQTISLSHDTSQALKVHNALLALRKVCKRYEFKPREQRGPLNQIVSISFPLLLPLAQRLVSTNDYSIEAAMMLKQILKIFWSSTQFYLPGNGEELIQGVPSLSNPQAMQPWFNVLSQALARPISEEILPSSLDERNAYPWWKVKKWSVQIMSRFFSRYGIPAYAEDEAKVFAQYFSNNVAPFYLQYVCETLNLRGTGRFCTDRVVYLCLTFIDLAIELAPTYKLLKPNLNFLLYHVCFPIICLSADDIDLFDNDPHEFVHRQNSPMADFYDPRTSAINLFTNVVKHRGKDVIPSMIGFLQEKLHSFIVTPEAMRNYVEKDGTLLIIGSLSDVLFSKKKYIREVEGLLISSVFPDFNSPVGFLRSRACWMVQRFSFVTWSDNGTTLNTLIHYVLKCLSDAALPVQIEASKALRYLIESDNTKQTLLPVLPTILNEYFRIMNEIGNDEVISALEAIIDKFGDHIEPHAVALVTQLTTAFSNYCDAGEDDDDAAMAAAQCLECVSTVLKGICERPDFFRLLEPALLPMTKQILSKDGEYIEYLEYALDIITFLTYFPESISAELWELFPLIYIAFDRWAFDYLNLMVPPLENFIGKDPEAFATKSAVIDGENISYIDLIFSIVTKTLIEDRSSESEIRKSLSLYMSLFLNCKGLLDRYLPTLNDQVLSKIAQEAGSENSQTRIQLFVVLASTVIYNTQAELMELEKRNLIQQIIMQWCKDAQETDRWLPRKITVIALGHILQVPTSSLSSTVQQMIPHLITTMTIITNNIEADAKIDEHDQGDINDEHDEDEEDEDFEGFGEDQDVHNVEDDEYLDALKGFNGNDDIARFLVGDNWNDDDDDDDEFISPLDDVETLNFYRDCLRSAYEREPSYYQQVQTMLAPETLQTCQRLFNMVDESAPQTK